MIKCEQKLFIVEHLVYNIEYRSKKTLVLLGKARAEILVKEPNIGRLQVLLRWAAEGVQDIQQLSNWKNIDRYG